MIKNTSEFPDSIALVVGFDIVDDVVVRYDLFVFVVDKTFERDTLGLLLEIVLRKVVVDKSNNLSSISSAIIFRGHEKCVVEHLFWRKRIG